MAVQGSPHFNRRKRFIDSQIEGCERAYRKLVPGGSAGRRRLAADSEVGGLSAGIVPLLGLPSLITPCPPYVIVTTTLNWIRQPLSSVWAFRLMVLFFLRSLHTSLHT